MPQTRMLTMIIIIGISVAALQIIIWRVSKPNKFFKYIPTLVLMILGVICIVKAVYFSTGMEDLAYFVVAMITMGVMLISLIAGLVIDIIYSIKK